MEKRRVVITGAGVVSPIGVGLEAYWEALREGKNGIDLIRSFDTTDFPSRIAAEVKDDFTAEDYIDRKEVKRMQPHSRFACAAAEMAVNDSGLDFDSIDRDRAGVVIGCGMGGLRFIEDETIKLKEKGPKRINPFLVPMIIANMPSGLVSIRYGLTGPNYATVTACASSNNAIADAMMLIQRGLADVMITGGTEGTITPLGMSAFGAMRAISTRNDEPELASRPFSRERDGFVMGEGSGIVVLETLESAQRRGATIYAELIGFGLSGDAHHISAPAPNGVGAAKAMRAAVDNSALTVRDIDHINAHGTSTPLGDVMEANAIREVFGGHTPRIRVNSTKSMTGHLLGGAGGVEMIAMLLALSRGTIHATRNYDPDPALDLNVVSERIDNADVCYAMSNSFGFGGHNACIIAGAYHE